MNLPKTGVILLVLLLAAMAMVPIVNAAEQTNSKEILKAQLVVVLDKQVADYNQAVLEQNTQKIKQSVDKIDLTLEKLSESGYTVDFTSTSPVVKNKNNQDIPTTVKIQVREITKENVKTERSYSANEEQLKIINELADKKITQGEFLEKVFPDALKDMPESTKEYLYSQPYVMASDNQKTKTSHVSPMAGEKATAALVSIVVHPESYIDQDILTGNVNFKSDSQVWLPYPWFAMPYMSVASELRRDDGNLYAYDYNENYNVYYIKTGHAVSGLTPGNYKTKGGHIAQAPAGYWPPSQTFFTETGYLSIY